MRAEINDRRTLIAVVATLLFVGFLATTLASYFVSKRSLRQAVVETELPLTSDNIYSEIQRDLIQPVLISSVMATDTFVRDWVLGGETQPGRMIQYLRDIKQRYGAFTSFFVSDKTRLYYHADGVLKSVDEGEPRDEWYFRVRTMPTPYEINVDPDLANQDAMTIFINYRVLDYQNNFIGATGIGLTVNAVRGLLAEYQLRFGRTVYLVDQQGRIVLIGDQGAVPEDNVAARGELGRLLPRWSRLETRTFEYQYRDRQLFLNVRFIPELGWYLLVEKDTDSDLAQIRGALAVNIAIALLITFLVLAATWFTVSRYQRRVEAMATTDKLTGMATRHAYDILIEQAIRDAARFGRPLSAVMLDIDRFKPINDQHGHMAGDRVLAGVANAIRASLRSSDITCRWGGDEFLVVLRNCDLTNAERIAETMRLTVEGAKFAFRGQLLQATVSAGVAVAGPGEPADRIVARADAALLRAKAAGRNTVIGPETALTDLDAPEAAL